MCVLAVCGSLWCGKLTAGDCCFIWQSRQMLGLMKEGEVLF